MPIARSVGKRNGSGAETKAEFLATEEIILANRRADTVLEPAHFSFGDPQSYQQKFLHGQPRLFEGLTDENIERPLIAIIIDFEVSHRSYLAFLFMVDAGTEIPRNDIVSADTTRAQARNAIVNEVFCGNHPTAARSHKHVLRVRHNWG